VQRQSFDCSVKVLALSVNNFDFQVCAASGILVNKLLQQQEFWLTDWCSAKVLACSVRNLDWQVGAATKFWRAASGILTDRLEQHQSFGVQRQEF
jgi:hypothetical protein